MKLNRADRWVLLTVWLLLLIAWFSTGCGGRGPAAASDLETVPYFRWSGAPTAEQRAYADSSWERIAVCVGIASTILRNFPIALLEAPQGLNTSPWPLYAYDVRVGREVAACGSSNPFRIKIINLDPECFTGGLPTEIMHVALWKSSQSTDYSNPLWSVCQWW